jgi:hypothetical protein
VLPQRVFLFMFSGTNFPSMMRPLLVLLRCWLAWLLVGGATAGLAASQLETCRKFYEQGNFLSAEGSCNQELAGNPQNAAAWRLLARSQLAQGSLKTGTARSSLDNARKYDLSDPENDLIAAEIAFGESSYGSAIGLAQAATSNKSLRVRAYQVIANSYLAQGEEDTAMAALESLLLIAPGASAERVKLANLLQPRDPNRVIQLIKQAPTLTAGLEAELGRAQWIAGRLPEAIKTLQAVTVKVPELTDAEYTRSLGALAYAYAGQGQIEAAQKVVFQQLSRRTNTIETVLNAMLPWALALVLLLGLHLVGESRIEPLSTIDFQEGPSPWTVSNVYSILISATVVAFLAALLGGYLFKGNFLALFTPVQRDLARAIFYSVLGLVLAVNSILAARRLGWKPMEQLLAKPQGKDSAAEALAVGVALIAATLGYQYLTLSIPAIHQYHLSFNFLSSPLVVVPVLLLPLAEVFFRAFAVVPMEKRYGRGIGYSILVLLYAIAIAAPLPLLLVVAALLLFISDRAKSAQGALIAQYICYIGLFVAYQVVSNVKLWF